MDDLFKLETLSSSEFESNKVLGLVASNQQSERLADNRLRCHFRWVLTNYLVNGYELIQVIPHYLHGTLENKKSTGGFWLLIQFHNAEHAELTMRLTHNHLSDILRVEKSRIIASNLDLFAKSSFQKGRQNEVRSGYFK